MGFHLPLLVRVAGTHGGDDFDKFDDWDEIIEFRLGGPGANYYVIEYIDYRSKDGFFRKYRVIFVDGDIFPYHLAIHDDWKVHHFRTDMANHAWMRKEEERFLDDMGGVFNVEQQDALRAIARATGLDYGGVDCGIDPDGRIVVFEANASMLVHDEKECGFRLQESVYRQDQNCIRCHVVPTANERLSCDLQPVSIRITSRNSLELARNCSECIYDIRIEVAALTFDDDRGCLIMRHGSLIDTLTDQGVVYVGQRHKAG